MFSAVTLSRSPPRADTTMMATLERSRICLHSSNPSASGSMRSSSTMSGCSRSSSASALLPSDDTSVSNPRTARFALMRSTMFGSSSMISTLVGVVRLTHRLAPSLTGFQASPREGVTRKQVPRSARLQLEPAAVRGHDAAGDGQPEPGA